MAAATPARRAVRRGAADSSALPCGGGGAGGGSAGASTVVETVVCVSSPDLSPGDTDGGVESGSASAGSCDPAVPSRWLGDWSVTLGHLSFFDFRVIIEAGQHLPGRILRD